MEISEDDVRLKDSNCGLKIIDKNWTENVKDSDLDVDCDNYDDDNNKEKKIEKGDEVEMMDKKYGEEFREFEKPRILNSCLSIDESDCRGFETSEIKAANASLEENLSVNISDEIPITDSRMNRISEPLLTIASSFSDKANVKVGFDVTDDENND